MDEGKGWLRSNWRTAMVLVLIFGLALFLRTFFVSGVGFVLPPGSCDAIYTPTFSGGSDSYYWDRALCYSFQTGRDLGTDPMLNYPLGLQNPRPPLFPWFSLLVGRILSPLFASGWQAVFFTFLLSTGLFGALTIFPTYALGKEAFGRKAGIIAALLLAISVGHLQRSAATDTDHDAFTLFFVVTTFYFMLRALRTLNRRRWVEGWSTRAAIVSGVRLFVKENRTSILYAFLAGLSVAVIALAWQGWAYVAVILMVWFGVELFLDRFRNEDTMGAWILFVIALGTPLVLALQWYVVRTQVRVWFDVPVYLFAASFVLGLAFTVTRDYPWTLVIPSTLVAAAAGLGVGVLVNPTLTTAFVTGAGYFIQSKVVSTIAEDQLPGMSQMILAFGLFTFGLALLSIGYLVYQIPRRRDPSYNLFVVWAGAAVFMAITAARFIFNASPAFALLAGFAVDQILVRADFATMRRTYRSLATGSWRNAIRKSLKLRHILAVLGIVFLVLLPNVWWAVDASIPFDLKAQYDRQIGNLLPSFLRAPGYNPSQGPFYLGAFGYNVPKASEYYPAAWQWFATRDADQPRELRPAFLSWWDYGFEAVDRGAHPTVADNFQDGFALSGQFITAQSESEGIALLAIRLLEGDMRFHRPNLSPGVVDALNEAGLSPDLIRGVLLRPADYIPTVLADPVRFGPWAPDMQPQNAGYIFLTRWITERLDKEGIVTLYHALRAATGWDIGYFAVDARLFPISVQNTGIFYAPVKLSDHRILQLPDGRVLPVDFFQILVTTNLHGSDTPIQFIGPGEQINTQKISYRPAFYNSMFYRAYIGYSPTDLGSPGVTEIPGIGQSLQSTPPMPAWNLTHFRLVYRTAYYNPYRDPANHTDSWRAVNYDEAQRLQANITAGTIQGTVDLNPTTSVANGVVFLRYYDGALVNGTVWAGSSPLPGVRITVTDELGTPHYVTTTDAAGRYSALLPFGDITLTASVGTPTRTTLVNSRILATTKVHVTEAQAMRSPADLDGDGLPDWILSRDLRTEVRQVHGTAYYDLNRNAAFGAGDVRVPGATITLTDRDFDYRRTGTTGLDGTFSIGDLPPGTYSVRISAEGRLLSTADITPNEASGAAQDVRVPFSIVRGATKSSAGETVPAASVEFRDETNGTVIPAVSQEDGSYAVGPLLAGNFTITAASGDLASPPTRAYVSGSDVDLNLTLAPSGLVAGTTTLFGSPQPFATLAFQSAADPQTIRTISSDRDGRYSIRLAAGDWFVSGSFYASTALYAALGRVTVAAGATASLSPNFVTGVRLNGTVRSPTTGGSPQASVAFASAAGELWVRTDSQGDYLALLPSGPYDVEAFNRAGSYFASLSIAASGRMDIALVASSETVAWRAYRDTNGNGTADPGEDVPGARIDLRDALGARVFLTTPVSGDLTVPLSANRTYGGTVTATGYEPVSIPPSTPAVLQGTVPVRLTPSLVRLQGTVLVDGGALVNHPVRVALVPVGGGAVASSTTSDSNGGFSLGLVPGTYAVVVDENVSTSRDARYQNLGPDRIVLGVGQPGLSHDIRVVVRNRIQGEVTLAGQRVPATLRFDGPERGTANASAAGYEIYLRPGTYTVTSNRTQGSNDYAFVSSVTVPSAANVSFVFAAATRVSGRALFSGAGVPGPMPVSFVRQGGGTFDVATGATGTYETVLPPGSYSVSLSGAGTATEGGILRYYRFAFQGNLIVPTNQATLAYDLATSRGLDNTTLSGHVTSGGVGTAATLTFTAREGGAITAQAASDSSGAYAVPLAPGTYDVYATPATGSVAFLDRITVPHAATVGRDIRLVGAFVLSGVTTDSQGASVSTAVTIQSSGQIDLQSDGSGAFRALLPAGAYSVTATRSASERGIAVTYRATTSVSLHADASVNLRLEKVVARSASLTWDATERRTIPAGGTVTYTIVVRNTGNVADTLTFSGTPAGWTFAFAPSSMTLDYGTPAPGATLRVVIQAPAGALVDHGPIQIAATSGADSSTVGTVTVQVDIERVRALSAALEASAPVFDGHHLDYGIVVKNAGNGRESVDVAVANPDDLAAAGWSVQLGTSNGTFDGTTLRNVSIDANGSARISLRAQSATGASGAQVVLRVSAQDSAAVSAETSFGLNLPDLAPGGATASGPEITRTAPTNTWLLAIVVGAGAAVAAGLLLSRRRR